MTAKATHRTFTVLVACLATAMLMLDISVVNTAISDIASSLHASLSGLQWVVDAYTLPLAATALALIAQVTPTTVLRAKALAAYGATIGAAFAISIIGALTTAGLLLGRRAGEPAATAAAVPAADVA